MVLAQKQVSVGWDRNKPTTWGQLIYVEGGKSIQGRKDKLVNKRCWENWAAMFKRMELERSLTPDTGANSKWVKDLNVKLDTTK